MSDTSKQSIKLFYCYAREDKDLREQFEKALSGLKRHYRLGNWYDREILAGQNWEEAIAEQLNSANVIFLLISPDFIASDYCYGTEMQRALERHAEGSCLVIPILLRPTHWKGTPFGTLQLLPTDARPITRWPDRDDAFEDVVKEVSRAIEDLLVSLKTKKDWLDEGISFRNQKRYEEALSAFEQALLLDLNYLEAYQERGITLHALKRYEEALSTFEQALLLNPSLAPLSIAKGQILNALERYEEALIAFEQAIHLDPNLVDAYLGRDKALQQLGVSKKAQERLESQLQEAQQQLADQRKQTAELEGQLERIQQQKDEALGQLGMSKEAQERIANQLKEAQQQMATQHKRSVQLENDLQNVRLQLSTEQKQSKELESRLQQTSEKLATQQKRVKQLENELQEARHQLTTQQKRTEQLESQLQSSFQSKQSKPEVRASQTASQQPSTLQHQTAPSHIIFKELFGQVPITTQKKVADSINRINVAGTDQTISPSFDLLKNPRRIQLNITGTETGQWNTTYSITTFHHSRLLPGSLEKPDATITLAETDWLDILEGKLNPADQLGHQFSLPSRNGRIKVEGNISAARDFLQSLYKLFY